MVDIAFLAHYLCLQHAKDHPEARHPNTRQTLENLKTANILPTEQADRLLAAQDLWMGLMGILALTIEGELNAEKEAQISGALAEDLVRVGDSLDFDDLKTKVQETAVQVMAIYDAVIDEPASRLPDLGDNEIQPEEVPL